MSQSLALSLALLLIGTVSASLPRPQHAEMTAVDMNQTLHWDCNYTQLESPVNFTVMYAYSNFKENEDKYKQACSGSSECRCDFRRFKLDFMASYVVRVRAEAGNQHSDWTLRRFTPHEDVQLSLPRFTMKADRAVIVLTISESVMSAVMPLQYSVRYWERLDPQQENTIVYDGPHAPLRSLKSQTEYCVQVSTFSEGYKKFSNYSSAQCVYTTGETGVWVWLTPLILLFASAVVGASVYTYYKCRRNLPVFTAPESILAVPSVPLLEGVQEECCTIAHVITPAIPLTHTGNEEQEEDDVPELQAPESSCHWTDGAAQDSGFSSGLES
ncbi:interferon alpha/beta receptor 1a-like isoform X2 [Clarias magur]|uniref:Interferon alpha/beta receptor 1a-like isoform X2 n=1 Tax=Clarias magur TaxID=1594786 RepID=A0A8J4XEY4_CLAMG|nr:interferon alpha/beta receptor 1a-like isoform X2 [Clarias magur]